MAQFNSSNIKAVVNALNEYGITNPFVQLGILATVSKESAFVPKTELGYGATPASRIRMIWPTLFSGMTDAEIDSLKKDNVKFFDKVYNYPGNKLGNIKPGDGWKYVGRGFNGITGRDQYKLYGDLMGVDLINNPERLNEVKIAAKGNALYFKRRFENKTALKNQIGVSDTSQIKDQTTGLKAALAANAGWGKNMNDSFHIENEKRAMSNIEYLKQFIGKSSFNISIFIALIAVTGALLILTKI